MGYRKNYRVLFTLFLILGVFANSSFAAICLCGGIGWVMDRWLGTAPWLLVGGLLLGIVVGFFELARIVWRT